MNNQNELLASQRVLSMLESACEYSEQILDNIPSVFVVLNQDNRIIRANHAFCDLVGCSMERAMHQDFTRFFTQENRSILLHHFHHVRSNAERDAHVRIKLEICGVHDQLMARPFLWRVNRLEHISEAEGHVISLVGEDLSGLYQSELKLMSIFASIPLGLMVLNRQGVITEVLSEYCHVLLNRRQLVGESLHQILAQSNPEQCRELEAAFNMLHESFGRQMPHYVSREASLMCLAELKIDGVSGKDSERRIKPCFQPIVRNDLIDRYMVTLEDVTASYMARRQIEKADLLGRQAQAMYECAIRDPLSGLYTRLFMKDSIGRLISAVKRGTVQELSIVIFDLDNFKSVNDSYGHDAGDKVIAAFGRIIRSCTRESDVPVRYGGEEFVIALPSLETEDVGAVVVAERIRQKLADTPIDVGHGRTLHVTTSCGVAHCHVDDTLDALIGRADNYLYEAKQNGKNRVCVEVEEGN
jgi:two-component system cell cycle response regulator